MKFGTLSLVCGTEACNAKCPFCVSKMTTQEENIKEPSWARMDVAARLATMSGATTALITGKGEPTLFPKLVTRYVARVSEIFPLIELQTNGLTLAQEPDNRWLHEWSCRGMTLVCLSIVHFDSNKNAKIMDHAGFEIWELVDRIHNAGMAVRINCTAMHTGICTKQGIADLIMQCRKFSVEQLTIREVAVPDMMAGDNEVYVWAKQHKLPALKLFPEDERKYDGTYQIKHCVEELGGQKLLVLPHNAIIYDVDGQNVCVNNCLTDTLNPDEIRQLIYFPDGQLRYDWKYRGSRII